MHNQYDMTPVKAFNVFAENTINASDIALEFFKEAYIVEGLGMRTSDALVVGRFHVIPGEGLWDTSELIFLLCMEGFRGMVHIQSDGSKHVRHVKVEDVFYLQETIGGWRQNPVFEGTYEECLHKIEGFPECYIVPSWEMEVDYL